MSVLLEPFSYDYMTTAIWVSALVGAVCAFLSAYLMLKGWSLIGDALSHSVVPGVAGAYMLGLPYSLGAFISGGLAAAAMLFISQRSSLRNDAVIGLVFTGFFGLGLFLVSLSPTSVDVNTIIFGNILAISPMDALQLVIISGVTLVLLFIYWKDIMVVFFDESHARSIGLRTNAIKVMFFTLLSASTVAALQTVGAFLVIAMVVTPGATAYLLTDRFHRLVMISVFIGATSSALGAYSSYFLDGATGGIIVLLQTLIFILAFVFAPKHGILASKRRAREHRAALRKRSGACNCCCTGRRFIMLVGIARLVFNGRCRIPRRASRYCSGLHSRATYATGCVCFRYALRHRHRLLDRAQSVKRRHGYGRGVQWNVRAGYCAIHLRAHQFTLGSSAFW